MVAPKMLKVMIEEELYDKGFISTWTLGMKGFSKFFNI